MINQAINKYTQIKVSVDPETALEFKKSCNAAGVSMAGVISKFMADYSQTIKHKPPGDPFGTRRKRRGVVKNIILQMEQLADAEERYLYNMPENLRNSVNYETAEQIISVMQETIGLLEEIYQ